MMEVYGGRTATVEEIAAGTGQGRRTVERDLQQMGLSPQKGQYAVPTPLEFEKKLEELERRGEELKPAPRPSVEEAPAADLPHKFVDSLPRLPVAVRPAVRGFGALAGTYRQWELARTLLEYVEHEKLDVALTMGATIVRTYVEDGEVPRDSVYAVEEGLRDPDWERRTGFVLSLYTMIPGMPTVPCFLEGLLRRPDLPAGVRRHIESAIRRRKFIDEQGGRVRLQL
jgi:hypothetical protein